MRRIIVSLVLFIFISVLVGFIYSYFASQKKERLTEPVITIINPLRGSQLGLENVDLLASIKGQWAVTKEAKLPATWLWQYSTLEEEKLINFAKSEMKEQEFGIFLEIDRNLAAKSDVVYRGRGPWYFSDGLFLISYDAGERKKIIDTVFAKFKQTFGYYPKTVGGWWVGADSLEYMQKKYNITASLQVADQFDLDVYSVWGTPWSIPYVASARNAAIPAEDFKTSSRVVIMQWAPRDPTYAYGNTPAHSTYSIQDYFLKKYDLSYIDYLFNTFLNQPGDQVIVGLEGGFTPQAYEDDYKKKLTRIAALQKENKVTVMTAENFAERFLSQKKVFAGTNYFLSKAYDSSDQSFWYQSSFYRAGILKKGDEVFLVDLRDYTNPPKEDFAILPNSQRFLRVTTPVIIDSARSPAQKILVGKTQKALQITKENESIILTDGIDKFVTFTANSLTIPKKQFIFTKDKENNHNTFLFSKKELFLFPLLGWLPLSLTTNLNIFQVVPFFLFVLVMTLFILKKKLLSFAISVFVFILFYVHLPQGLVTEFITRKKLALVSGVGLYIFFFLGMLIFIYLKRRKYFFPSFVTGLLALIIVGSMLILSWQNFILTPFELQSLEVIKAQRKDVYFVLPKEQPVYRRIEPLLFENYSHGAVLTRTNWEAIVRPEGKFLVFDHLDKKIIFVPRYLGSDLYPEEIEKYKLKKIFDNAQIALFSL